MGLFMLWFMGFIPLFGLACAGENVPLHSPFVFANACSRESVPFAGVCTVLLVFQLVSQACLALFDL